VDTSVSADASIDELVDLMRFDLTCERGKTALGEGNGSIGDLLPGYFAQHGIVAWERRLCESRAVAVAIEQSSFHTAGGVIHYVVSGRRPG
jgi:hypothetical protein